MEWIPIKQKTKKPYFIKLKHRAWKAYIIAILSSSYFQQKKLIVPQIEFTSRALVYGESFSSDIF